MSFANRIVGEGVKPASQFLANPLNWRTHPQRQRDAVNASLSEVGWVQQVIENVRTGHLVDGHERVWQALQNDDADVPFLQVDISEDEERLVLATLDPMAAMATADADILADLLAGIETESDALTALLDDLAKEHGADLGVIDFSDFDAELGSLDGFQEENITITVPAKFRETVVAWLANGEQETAPGLGKGVLRRCGLL